MRNSKDFANLLIGIEREIEFTNIRLHGSMRNQFLDEENDSIKRHISEQIAIRDKEIINDCKSMVRATIISCGEILPNKVEVILTGSDLVRIDEVLDSILEEIK